jgi:hypothetical protein
VKEKIKKAITAHGAWKDRLSGAIGSGSLDVPVANVKVDNLCEFGKWLYGEAGALSANAHYSQIKELHAQFHRAAGTVAELAVAGKKAEAQAAMSGEYSSASEKLIKELNDWDASL